VAGMAKSGRLDARTRHPVPIPPVIAQVFGEHTCEYFFTCEHIDMHENSKGKTLRQGFYQRFEDFQRLIPPLFIVHIFCHFGAVGRKAHIEFLLLHSITNQKSSLNISTTTVLGEHLTEISCSKYQVIK
jgi:hypothetical protein